METTVNERFQSLIKVLGMNVYSFSKSVGKSHTSIQNIVESRSKPGFEILELVLKTYPTLSRDWLIMGEGEMFKATEKRPTNSNVEYLQVYLKDLEDKFNRLIDQYDVKDRQIEGMQRTIDVLLGKSEGVIVRPLLPTENKALA